jgi:hypothetical protein
MIQSVKLLCKDLRVWILLEEYRGNSLAKILLFSLPFKAVLKLYALIAGFINNHFLINLLNSKRFQDFQNFHQDKLGNHFYIIVMPNILPYLAPCINLIPKNINLFLILNGIGHWEANFLRKSYKNIPIFKLKLLPHSSLSHGRLLNLLLTHNQHNFGIIDHDLYLFNKDIFNQLQFKSDEFIIGIYKLTNTISQLTFPTTHFLFFNLIPIKNIMLKYKIGAQKYRIIPSRLKNKLAALNLGYHNFLKEYLNYFDTLNLIMAMAFFEKFSAKMFELSDFEDVYHLGGTSHGPDNLYRTYRTLKFLEISSNDLLREKFYHHFSSFNSSKDMVKLFPDDINSRKFIDRTDQMIDKLENFLQK